MMPRYLAPAGAPISLRDLARWARISLVEHDLFSALTREIEERFGVRHAYLTSTGRAGMTVLLRALRRLAPARCEVVLPAYTCYSVAASVVKAGLTPRIVDVDPDTLDFAPVALASLDFSRVLAIVATNLYGLANDLTGLERTARERGVFLIDDGAQSMGTMVDGRSSGACGDAGLYSFDKGKPVPAIDGGAIVTRSDTIGAAIAGELRELPPQPLAVSLQHVAKALAYAVLLRPWLYWLPNRIPQLELGRTVFSTEFEIAQHDRALAALALATLGNLTRYQNARKTNATSLISELEQVRGLTIIRPRAGVSAGFVRAPVLINDPSARDHCLALLQRNGIGASASYPQCLVDVPELRAWLAPDQRDTAGGRYVAARIVTLPTHPFVTAADRARIVSTIKDAVSGATVSILESKQQTVCAE